MIPTTLAGVHTLARLRGHGLVLTPRSPFVLRRIGDGVDDRVAVQHSGLAATLDPAAPGAPELEAVGELLLADGPTPDAWLVAFGAYAVSWPNHHAVASSDLDGVPFELWGPEGSALFVQGPYDPLPTEAQLAGDPAVVVARGAVEGAHWLELTHEAPDGTPWRQRHHLLPPGLVVSAQAPAAVADEAMAVAATLVTELLDHCPCAVEPARRSAEAGATTAGEQVWRCETCNVYWRGPDRGRARRISPQLAAVELGLLGG